MAGYQIIGLRTFFDEKTRKYTKYDAFFEQRWRVDNVADIFRDPIGVLDKCKVPHAERWNLFYTVAHSGDTKRAFKRLEMIAFDLDGIEVARKDEYIPIILEVLSVAREKTAIVFSGNGLHFLVKIYPAIDDKSFFDERRSQYRAICTRINQRLEELRLPGKADSTVFEGARILRFPGTINRKPDKLRPDVIIDKQCLVLQGNLEVQEFDFDKVSGAPRLSKEDAIPLKDLKKYRTSDGAAAFEECLFLKHVRDDAASLPEPEWYASASIIGRFDKGRELFHEISKAHPGYRPGATDEKFDQAIDASGPRTCKSVNNVWGGCSACPLYQKISSPVVIFGKDVIPTEATGFYHRDLVNANGTPKPPQPCYDDLLRKFQQVNPYKTIADMKTIFVFNGTHYTDITPIEVKGFAERMFHDPKPSDKVRNEFVCKVLANEIVLKDFFTSGTENRINFKNGVLDLSATSLLAHSPEYGFRTVLPYDFTPDAKCPTFDWWIDDIMLGDKELIAILQEFMGYVVRGGEYKYHKALWLSGTGRNGKSTFIHVLKALIGKANYSTLSIKQIVTDKFASSGLDGKIANFSEETSPEELADSGPFKNLTGDGEINAQKKYGDQYQFENRAKMIMSYNEVPMLKDLSTGMLERPIIIPFKKDLTAHGAQDKTLKKRLMAELPGIFNFALAGWRRLEEQQEFSRSEKSSLEMEEIRDASCSAAQWVRENIEFLPLETCQTIKGRALYQQYKSDVGQYAYAEAKFAKRIQSISQVASRRRRTEYGTEYVALKIRNSSPFSGDY